MLFHLRGRIRNPQDQSPEIKGIKTGVNYPQCSRPYPKIKAPKSRGLRPRLPYGAIWCHSQDQSPEIKGIKTFAGGVQAALHFPKIKAPKSRELRPGSWRQCAGLRPKIKAPKSRRLRLWCWSVKELIQGLRHPQCAPRSDLGRFSWSRRNFLQEEWDSPVQYGSRRRERASSSTPVRARSAQTLDCHPRS